MQLTPRQREIAALIARGLSNSEIAHETGITVNMVAAHIHTAAARLPGDCWPRHKLLLWHLGIDVATCDKEQRA